MRNPTKTIKKATGELAKLGFNVICVAEQSEWELGEGMCYVAGRDTSPLIAARQALNELKVQLKKVGMDFRFTLTEAK